MDDEGFGKMLRGFMLMGLITYIIPILLIAGVLIGGGIGIGYLIWG